MTTWQILRAGRASQAALGYHVHHGPWVSVQYSTATAALEAPDSSRTFSLSRGKVTLQQLNRRLASYLKQVQCLETTKQRLEHQIQKVLDKKYPCPKELKELDRHLKAVTMLQDQITECLCAQAHIKLQLLNAELRVCNFAVRCEKEREHREHVEMELSNLRLQKEELMVHKLPELQNLLTNQTQQIMELQIQHQQDMQSLLAHVSGGLSLEMQTAESSDVIQQLVDLRPASLTLINKNQNECWFNPQVSMLSSSEVSFDPSEEVVQAGLKELRRTAASLKEELTQLQSLNVLLDASGLEQAELSVLQLVVLQQRADSVCRELDSVVQATAQHAAGFQTLLDIKIQLENEIQKYRRLQDELSQEGPAACKRHAPLDRTVETQKGHICTPGQTPVVTLQATTVQPPVSTQLSQSSHPKQSSAMVINTSDLMESIHTSVKQGTGAFLRKTEKESMTMNNAMKALETSQTEVHTEDPDLLKSFPVSTQISQDLDKLAVVQAPKLEAQEITMSAHRQLSARIAAVQAKADTDKTGTNIQTEIPKAKLGEKAELKQGLHCITQTATADPGKQTASVLETDTGTVNLPQTNSSKGSVQARPPSETVSDTSKITVPPYKASGPHFCRAKGIRVEVFGEWTVANDKDIEPESAEAEATSLVLKSDQHSALSDVFNSKQNKITEHDNTKSGTVISPVSSPDSNSNIENKTASTEILKKVESVNKEKVANDFHETNELKVAPTLHYSTNLAGQEVLLNTTVSKKSISLTDSGVALSLSDPEEFSSPGETDVFLSPTKTVAYLSPKICPGSFETEMLMSYADQAFCQADSEDHVKIPVLLLSPNDPAVYLSRNYSEKCLSPVETNRSLSPKGGEEEEKACLMEAKAHMKPVEKCILSTKEEGQSLSFSSEHVFPEKDRNRRVTISVQGGESLCFGSFKNNKIRSSSPGGTGFRTLGGSSILGDKGEQLEFDTLHWKNVKDTITSRDSYRNTDSVADNKDVKSPGGRYDSENHKEIPLPILSGSVVRSSGNMPASNTNVAMDLAANFSGTIANSSGTVNSNAEPAAAGVQGRFRCGGGEWIIYGDSLGRKSFLDSASNLTSKWTKEGPLLTTLPASSPQEIGRFDTRRSSLDGSVSLLKERSGQILSVATNPVTINPPETGRSGKRESEEWMAYCGSFQQKHSVDSSFSLLKTKGEGSPAMEMVHATSQPSTLRFGIRGRREWVPMVTHLATSPPQIRRYGNKGSGEWMVCGSSDSLLNTESKECLPITTNLATSPPGTGRFGINGNGEWRVYGGHIGHMSSLAGSNSLGNPESTESQTTRQLATSPPVLSGAGRFGNGGSGEWQVYRGSNGHLGSAGGTARISDSVKEGQTISPSCSYTHRRQRFSSASSGGRLSSGSVVRRSRSVGSSGRLSSSGGGGKFSSSPNSHRRSPGKFSTGSELKPIYSSGSGCRSSVGSAEPSNGRRMTNIKTTPCPSGRISSSGQWLSINDRMTSQASGGFSSSSAPGRTNSTGGRIIDGSDRSIRSTCSGAGGNKERISVCKMAALSISAAGREKSQERRKPAQQSLQQHAAATSLSSSTK